MHRTLHTWQHVLLLTITALSLFFVREEVNGGLFLLCKLAFATVPPYCMLFFLTLSVFKLTTERHTELKYYLITVESQCQLKYVS